MAGQRDRILGQIEAKLDSLHEEVTALKVDVDDLKRDMVRRATFYKIFSWVTGILSTIGTLLLNYYLRK